MNTKGKFFLGKFVDAAGNLLEEPVLYDPKDLTTHAVVVGMTGSGKTGLCLALLEETALNNIPALMIDPKGDITNALLHFPDLLPEDFKPWVNADEARRTGKSIDDLAAETAQRWQKGLSEWGIDQERIKRLEQSAHFTIFTPGSDAGTPISILASFKAPDPSWAGNREILLEKVSGTVTALLGLVGMDDIDPMRSKEHIFLSNIFETAWNQGHDLDLGELILQVQSPPFTKLGVFDVNQFFPEKDRLELAMLLNNILASPGFQFWINGVALEINELLYGPDGRPRHSIFYIAHLNDQERMFFVTLLYSAVETWMRTQAGTTSLRALVYFDEIFGYLPPVRNPPSKTPMLRMLKQARAFGVGLLLATQNPTDLDYKALSNIGTWFIGKLQTDRDKMRLLDGLEGAASGGLDRREFDRLLSGLGKRVFLMHNVHESQPHLFQTRWVMNYMAGPLTRAQIPRLNQMGTTTLSQPVMSSSPNMQASADSSPRTMPEPTQPINTTAPVREQHQSIEEGSRTKPALPTGVEEYFLPHTLTASQSARLADKSLPSSIEQKGILYRPVLLAQASIRFTNRTYNLNTSQNWTALIEEVDSRGIIHWEDYIGNSINLRDLDRGPVPNALFGAVTDPFSQTSVMGSIRRDFVEWLYRNAAITVRANSSLKVYAGPEVSQAEFIKMCENEAKRQMEIELGKKVGPIDRKLKTLGAQLSRAERSLEDKSTRVQQRRLEEVGTHAETILGLFSKRKRSVSSSLTKRRMTKQAEATLDETKEVIKQLERDITDLNEEKKSIIESITTDWQAMPANTEEIAVNPMKKDILVELFGVAWFPYLIFEGDVGRIELPGYPTGEARTN